jgi:hypothetical protein
VRKAAIAALVAVFATSAVACKKTGEGEYQVEKPVVGTKTDTINTPSVDVTTEKDTITTPEVTTEKKEVEVPKVKVNPPKE